MDNNEPIRVAHIIGKWVGGGVEAVVMNYYRHIDRNKIQFDFICDDDSTNIPYEEIEKLGGKIILVPPYQKMFKYQKEMKKILKDGNYKIVHSHINALSVFPLRAAKKADVHVRIAHSHSTTNKKEWKKNILKSLLKPFSKVYATDYFACTEHAGRWLFGDKEFDNGNVFVLNNAIDLEKFKFDEETRKNVRNELNIDDETLVVGHIGRFVEQKNHMRLIAIFDEIHKRNSDSILLLVGQGPLTDEVQQKVNELNLSNNVKFLGQRKNVNELYQALDIFVLPSLYEGLGIVLIEAQAAGLCCVCSTEVPKVAKVTDNLTFIELEKDNNIWAEEILANYETLKDRNNFKEEIITNGYDINIEKIKLEEKYIRLK